MAALLATSSSPTHGAPDGSALEPEFINNVESLRLTGEPGDSSNVLSGVSAVSRQTHGSAGDYDIPLPLSGTPGIECRSAATPGEYRLVVQFPNPVNSRGLVEISSGSGQVQSANVSGGAVTVIVSGLVNAQTTTVRLNDVSTGGATGDVSVPISLLNGDTNADRLVNSGDALQTRSRSGHTVNATTFRSDLNRDGLLNTGDATIVRSRAGTGL